MDERIRFIARFAGGPEVAGAVRRVCCAVSEARSSASIESHLRFCVGFTVLQKNFLNRLEQLNGSDWF
jgi:hypothetical protein